MFANFCIYIGRIENVQYNTKILYDLKKKTSIHLHSDAVERVNHIISIFSKLTIVVRIYDIVDMA